MVDTGTTGLVISDSCDSDELRCPVRARVWVRLRVNNPNSSPKPKPKPKASLSLRTYPKPNLTRCGHSRGRSRVLTERGRTSTFAASRRVQRGVGLGLAQPQP